MSLQECDDMAYGGKSNKLRRQEAVGLDELVRQFVKEMKLDAGLNRERVSEAWDVVSGAGRYTLDVALDKGVLYCTLSSSIVRNQLYFQKDVLASAVNEALKKDELFIWDWSQGPCVRTLVLR